jgi:glycosyltransferase involved in cell wall biosynthesis
MGGRLQWHTKSHPDLTKLSKEKIKHELEIPTPVKKLDPQGFKWFAYPYGRFNQDSQDLVEKLFVGGIACDTGNFEDKTIWPREIIYEKTPLARKTVSVIIPCYNYAGFLVEAIESVLRQTYLPDEIILSDDASTDHSYEIMRVYAEKYPSLIKLNRNEKNLGIEEHFNKAVNLTSGDFICLLGADNRFPSNYIEECVKALLSDEKTAIAYSDFVFFGNRAESVYKSFNKKQQGKRLFNDSYVIKFPEFNETTKEQLKKSNFIHGSSMYKRRAYEEAGGYKKRTEAPEDWQLFRSMVKNGWSAKKLKNVYLEYRQHSAEQANMQFLYFSELSFLREQFIKNSKRRDLVSDSEVIKLKKALDVANKELRNIRQSKAWKMARKIQVYKYRILHPLEITNKALSRFRGVK